MGAKTYNKLVRDKIPQIIEQSGKKVIWETLSYIQYIEMLETKLHEELSEYVESKQLEELADLLEVIYALAVAKGCTIAELELIRKQKAEQRGGFEDKLLLKEVIEG